MLQLSPLGPKRMASKKLKFAKKNAVENTLNRKLDRSVKSEQIRKGSAICILAVFSNGFALVKKQFFSKTFHYLVFKGKNVQNQN